MDGAADRGAAPSNVAFLRVVCGVDGSPEGRVAAREAGRIASEGASIVLVSVVDAPNTVAAHGGSGGLAAAVGIRGRAQRELREAAGEIEGGRAELRLFSGTAAEGLLLAATRLGATLVVVGSHGSSRIGGVVFGSVATRVLRDAPCSILVARGSIRPIGASSRITVGVDGSRESLRALLAARTLQGRIGGALTVVVAERDKEVDAARIEQSIGAARVEIRAGDPTDVLVRAGGECDLLVVGSRGRTGLRALGSVAERVAHRAPVSVLVVR